MSSEIPQHLARGKACVPCRKRKMKCDGNQPTCNQCLRFNRAAECEYNEGSSPSTARVLEQHISQLESRIAELEQDDPSLVRLHDPYANAQSLPVATAAAASQQLSQANWWDMPEPPTRMQQILVQFFMRHSSKLGFFFDPNRFVGSMASPTANLPRPAAVLRSVIYLWGINLSANPQYVQHEPRFLGRALRSVHMALSSAQQQQSSPLYVLQAEILLAYYFFHNNRLLEGKFHASAAVSLAYMCNLHKILSGGGGPPPLAFSPAGQAYLPPPIDWVDEGERIHAWWTVFLLDKTWATALAIPSMINENQEPGTVIDTPWPLTTDMYRQLPASLRGNVGATTRRFFADVLVDNEPSHLAMLAKASALYDRANDFASYDGNGPDFQATISALDTSIEAFKHTLPPLQRPSQSSGDTAHMLLLIHAICHCASIQLHRPFLNRSSTSLTRCLTAANTTIRVMHSLEVHNLGIVNPVIGVLASTASDALILGIRSIRSSRAAWAATTAVPGEEQFFVALNQLCTDLSGLSFAPFIGVLFFLSFTRSAS
ncbi:hypothetical protein BDW22DRAFT_1267164 [Trametopsis cervina]|nr:hypothetical protein BDW22DRAFT_1267164 [Trametopsis cervina]